MADEVVPPTTAETMVAALTAALVVNVGVTSVTVDGQTVTYNRQQAMTELVFWTRKVAKEKGKSRFRGIDMSGAY